MTAADQIVRSAKIVLAMEGRPHMGKKGRLPATPRRQLPDLTGMDLAWRGVLPWKGRRGSDVDTKTRELIDRLFIEANGNKSAFEEALREADIEFVSSES